MSINKERLEERKGTLQSDIEVVRNRIADWEKKKI